MSLLFIAPVPGMGEISARQLVTAQDLAEPSTESPLLEFLPGDDDNAAPDHPETSRGGRK